MAIGEALRKRAAGEPARLQSLSPRMSLARSPLHCIRKIQARTVPRRPVTLAVCKAAKRGAKKKKASESEAAKKRKREAPSEDPQNSKKARGNGGALA